jgi:carbonic anhydrase
MDELIEGYHRFRAHRWPDERGLREHLARAGQQPHTLAIACSDSRTAPELIFDCAPGEIFSLRNIANLVPPYEPDGASHGTSAAIEFAVRLLAVKYIAVIGHSDCGGVGALMADAPAQAKDFLRPWLKTAEPAKRRALHAHPHDPHAAQHRCEIENIRVSLENLRSFPWVAAACAAQKLTILGFYFDISTGILSQVEADHVTPIDEVIA